MSNMQILRKNIFDTMEDLRKNRISVAAANAISSAGQVIINSVKLEIDALKASGNKQLPSFITQEKEVEEVKEEEESTEDDSLLSIEARELNDLIPVPNLATIGITTHRMKDGGASDE